MSHVVIVGASVAGGKPPASAIVSRSGSYPEPMASAPSILPPIVTGRPSGQHRQPKARICCSHPISAMAL